MCSSLHIAKRKKLIQLLYRKVPPVINAEMAFEVLELCKLPESLNIAQMKELIHEYMTPRVSYYCEKKRSPYVEDELSEYFTAKSTNGVEIGSGSCAMDIQTKDNEGIDAMCVIMNNNGSNEKSLIQNFSSSGVDLDTLFKEKRDNEAVKLYMDQYSKKLHDVKEGKKLTDLYILSFVSTYNEVFLTCFKIKLENIKHVSSGGFIKNSSVNILVNNFINPRYGNVKLYKSKKRLELRLKPDVLNTEYAVKIYTMPEHRV